MSPPPTQDRGGAYGVVLTAAIVALTLSTAYIHSTLGGMLYTLNALGYTVLAVAILIGASLKVPVVVRLSWLPRVGLFAFTLTTVLGWMMVGARVGIAYIAKAIEAGLLVLLLVDSFRVYGGPLPLLIEARASVEEIIASLRR